MKLLGLAALCAVLAAGCGSDEAGTTPAPSADQQEAAEVAERYIDALAAKDWAGVCATRTESERKEFARMGGSCERLFEKLFAGKPVDLFEGAKAGDVRIEGDTAGVDLVQPGQTEPAMTVAVVHENGVWALKDIPDAQIP